MFPSMKTILAGWLCGGLMAVAVGQEAGTPAPTFSIPATDPAAEWQDRGLWAGVGMGYIDGPRLEAMSFTSPRPHVFAEDGGECIFRTYDARTDRIVTLAGCGSNGELDGPFSRARFGGWGYGVAGIMGGNSKFYYILTRSNDKMIIRRFDYAKRVVQRIPAPSMPVSKVCCFEGGIFLQHKGTLKKLSDDGKILAEYTLAEVPGGYGESLGPYDSKNDRLYGSSREGAGGWVAWYWDLRAGGKLNGLLLAGRAPENQPIRKQCATGSFKGSFFYCPGGMAFGPGDPDYRFPYMGGGDEANMYRLDLERQIWTKLVRTADGKRWRFGDAPGLVQAWDAGGGTPWANDGTDNIYPGYRGWTKFYERVK
jgi:hypothetical protein